MKEYKIVYEDAGGIQDSVFIKSNCKPNKIEAKRIVNHIYRVKCKIIDIITLD